MLLILSTDSCVISKSDRASSASRHIRKTTKFKAIILKSTQLCLIIGFYKTLVCLFLTLLSGKREIDRNKFRNRKIKEIGII
jgi:hypothetical protein